jgi:hypothetical protein
MMIRDADVVKDNRWSPEFAETSAWMETQTDCPLRCRQIVPWVVGHTYLNKGGTENTNMRLATKTNLAKTCIGISIPTGHQDSRDVYARF